MKTIAHVLHERFPNLAAVSVRASDSSLLSRVDGMFSAGCASQPVRIEYARAGKPMLRTNIGTHGGDVNSCCSAGSRNWITYAIAKIQKPIHISRTYQGILVPT